jgi:glycosyltransferase involved in cell wall biosynthesis
MGPKNCLHLVDMRFSLTGHYLDDLKEFSYLVEKYQCAYYAPIGTSEESIKINNLITRKISKKGVAFYFTLYRLLLLKRKEKIVFLSCSFIPLFILSVMAANFNYIFRVHSMPIVRVRVYKKIIRWLSNLSVSTIFLDYPVKDYFVSKGHSNPKKSTCVIGRTLDIDQESTSLISDKFNLLFIGAMNDEKDLKPIIDALCKTKINNLSLAFLSKGIEKYASELDDLKLVYEDVEIVNEFLDRSKYDKAIVKADALILPYKVTYGVRFSAVLNDALSLGKKVLTIKLPQFEYYSKKYNSCHLYTNKYDVIEAIEEMMVSSPIKIDELNMDYSLKTKQEQLKRLGL